MEDNQKRDERIEELRTKLQENDEIENWNSILSRRRHIRK